MNGSYLMDVCSSQSVALSRASWSISHDSDIEASHKLVQQGNCTGFKDFLLIAAGIMNKIKLKLLLLVKLELKTTKMISNVEQDMKSVSQMFTLVEETLIKMLSSEGISSGFILI